MNISQIAAIAKKEMKLSFRFKWNYLGEVLIQPFRFITLFAVVYYGFFRLGTKEIGEINKVNFISFLIIGSLVHTFFDLGFRIFNTKFTREKYWQTMFSFLIAPVHRLKLIIGMGLSEMVRLIIVMSVFFGVTYLITPVSVDKFMIVTLITLLLFFGALGLGLIVGAVTLANEDFLFLFNYTFWGWSFLSCFYYPISSLPKFLHPLVKLNPIYHGVSFIRELWFGLPSNFVSHIYFISLFAIITPLLGVFIFNEIMKRYNITGY